MRSAIVYQEGDAFPSKHLAGVGVVFYVLLALRALLRNKDWFNDNNIPEPNLAQFLDVVAIGTVADVAKLDYNNRILVDQGLRRIRANNCCVGVRALLATVPIATTSRNCARLGSRILLSLNQPLLRNRARNAEST